MLKLRFRKEQKSKRRANSSEKQLAKDDVRKILASSAQGLILMVRS